MTTISFKEKLAITGQGLSRLFVMAVLAGLLSGCGASSNMNTLTTQGAPRMACWDVVHLKTYQVTGQVLDISGNPVPDCRVYLIKRRMEKAETFTQKDNIDLLKELYAGTTDSEGNYFLTFEPGGANDLWLAFNAEKAPFEPKTVRLNDKIGNTLLDYPGTNPVVVNVVLE